MDQALSLYLLETIPLLDPESPRLRARPAHARRVDPREPGAHPAPAARQGEGPGGRRDEGRGRRVRRAHGASSRSSSTRSRCASSSTRPSTPSPTATRGWARRTSGRSRSRARCSRASAPSPTTSRSTTSSAPRACCCATSTASTRCSARPCPTARRPTRCARWSCYLRDMLRAGRLEPARRVGADARPRATGRAAPAPRSCGRRGRSEPPTDITRDAKAFTAAIRTRVFAFLRAWSIGDDEAALETLDAPADGDGAAVDGRAARGGARGATASSTRRPAPRPRGPQPPPHLRRAGATTARAGACSRCSSTPEGLNDWVLELEVDLAASRETGEPVLKLLRLGPLV